MLTMDKIIVFLIRFRIWKSETRMDALCFYRSHSFLGIKKIWCFICHKKYWWYDMEDDYWGCEWCRTTYKSQLGVWLVNKR